MAPTRTQAQLEIEALAAIGEALLFNARGNPVAVKTLFVQGSRFVAANAVLKRLTEVCHNAAHDPNWRTSTEARLQMLGRKNAERNEALMNAQQNTKRDSTVSEDLAGAFVETAFTAEEIERAIAEEKRLGLRDTPCAFLGKNISDIS